MKDFFRSIKILDIFILIALVVGIAGLGFLLYAQRPGTVRLVIESPQGTWIYPLDVERKLVIEGINGKTFIAIEDGAARVLDSACPNKTCTMTPPLKKVGDWAACLPNQVFLSIQGEAPEKTSGVPDI